MEFQATRAVAKFECLKDACPDTCCKSWSMQVEDRTFAKYQAPGLENAVAYDGVNGEIRAMRRDEASGYCVKFTDGICEIHRDYGAAMLGDACYFYPRVVRKFGEVTMVAASLSCPEIARLMMEDDAAEFVAYEDERLPQAMRDCGDGIFSFGDAVKTHNAFLHACKASDDAAKIMTRICSASGSLARIERKDWPDAADFMLRMADGKLPVAEVDTRDAERVLQIFAAVIHATGKRPGIYLAEVLVRIEVHLGVEVNWETLEIRQLSSQRRLESRVCASPRLEAPDREALDPSLRWDDNVMKKYLAAQLSFSFFPFAGIGENINDKAKLLCYKFALNKLALAATPDKCDAIKTIQSIARVIDHIADPTLVFNLMRQFGWERDGRMVGLLAI